MADVGTPYGGQRQVLADPQAKDPHRLFAVHFLIKLAQNSELFKSIGLISLKNSRLIEG